MLFFKSSPSLPPVDQSDQEKNKLVSVGTNRQTNSAITGMFLGARVILLVRLARGLSWLGGLTNAGIHLILPTRSRPLISQVSNVIKRGGFPLNWETHPLESRPSGVPAIQPTKSSD